MNKDRRKTLDRLSNELGTLVEKFKAKLGELQAEFGEDFRDLANAIDEQKSDEQDYYDSMPESLQGGEKGEASSQALEYLDSAYDKADALANALENDDFGIEALAEIDEAVDNLSDAAGV